MKSLLAHLYAQAIFLPTLLWNILLGRVLGVRRWWHRIDDHVLLGALPFASDVPALHAEGVRAVINTCAEYAGPEEAYRQRGIVQLRLPTADFAPPRLEDLEQAVRFLHEQADRGASTYVHCKAGRGRSATVVLCWLIDTQGLTPAAAQARLIEIRPHVDRHLGQRTVVQEFYRRRREPRAR